MIHAYNHASSYHSVTLTEMIFLDRQVFEPLSADIIAQPSSLSANIHKTARKLRSALDYQVHSLIQSCVLRIDPFIHPFYLLIHK